MLINSKKLDGIYSICYLLKENDLVNFREPVAKNLLESKIITVRVGPFQTLNESRSKNNLKALLRSSGHFVKI